MASYLVVNGPMPTTAAPASVATGTAVKTLLQIAPVAAPIQIIEWGISFDGSTAATPGKIELIETGTVFATVTAFAAADVMTFDDPNAPANTAGTSGEPLGLGTALSGYTASAEGTITATRLLDLQLLPPTAPYVKPFPLGERGQVAAGKCLRIRVTFANTVNAYCYVILRRT